MKSIYAARERGEFDATQWSDPEIEFVILHVRRGKVTREVTYFNRARGLAELGVAP